MISPGEAKTIHLRDYLDVIKRRRLPILSVFVVIVALVTTYTMLATRYYTATTQLLIEQTAQRSLSLQEALAVDSSAMDFYQTQYRLIESRTIATKVVTSLRLYTLPEFGAVAPSDLDQGEKPPTEEEAIRTAVNIFGKKLKVAPIRQSRLADISFTSKDPKLAAKVANATAQAYIDYVLDRKLAISQMAVKFLSRRIEEQRRKLQASQLALQKYMEENRLATVISENYNNIITQKLADLNQQLVDAETARKEAQAHYNLALKARQGQSQFESIKEFMDSPVIQKVRERELELSKREAELSQKYGARHPKMLALKAEKAALEREKRGEIAQIINSQESQLTLAKARESAIRQALGQQRQQAMDIRKKGIGFSVIKREVDTNQQLYDMLLTKVKEARVAEEIDVGMVTVVDGSQVPRGPSRPRVKLNILLAIVGGILVALFWGFILEYMDNTIKLPSQVEDQLGLPLLGSIPYDSALFQRGSRKKASAYSLLEVIANPKSVTIEPLRMVRASISLSKAGTPPKSLVVSSTAPMEGKSVISSFLAIAFAEAGKKTLIIDGDMRKPRQHRIWGLSNETGLSTLLSGQSGIESSLHREVIPNIDIITSGPLPPSPSELFQSELMSQLLTALGKAYSQIIIDSPPILPVADPVILGNLADGMVLVVAAAKLPLHALQQAVDKLKKSDINLLGVVLNQTIKLRSDYYYGGYKHKYYYRYDYYEEGQKSRRS
ncbi:MAG: polysaccharide biosynthesis tyrosine autokinase [Proteobacteria bacterium]|nr:polysaccharide biosynthesis tyrosine autokinase [Pseudomonadota bacterium]MBU1452600.1 polysaccharide biosynthesis tyrosine autokinase [Pseudomonadota bacterium]MBU2467911.1 polysaccharide biosynthesis tyrosine autokinase [Pseudomonadota bacterium]MBU2519333.1 polysaccharide biosynthesis tyrosine autokinase [Pseudomonadota bacterium]